MNVRRFFPIAASTALFFGGLVCGTSAVAQDLFPASDDAVDRTGLFDSLEETVAAETPAAPKTSVSRSNVRASQMSAAEIRQARALYRSQQRVARLEYNLWMGYEPLRPNWNSVPMMSSRYTHRRLYVPVYVRTR